jgi:UDP-2,3-diacylglucosamine hydrolase
MPDSGVRDKLTRQKRTASHVSAWEFVRYYFCSDVHLRSDRPERDELFARFVERLESSDVLIIGGDLCDFWLASRALPDIATTNGANAYHGLRALRAFSARGGDLVVLLGNHDLWLRSFYQEQLSARVPDEPFEITVCGLRVHLVHGHRVRTGPRWKQALESRAFSVAFSILPAFLARRLDQLLNSVNVAGRLRNHRAAKAQYRQYVQQRAGAAQIFLFGHVHERVDEKVGSARLVVLGDWKRQASYLVIDESGASFCEG